MNLTWAAPLIAAVVLGHPPAEGDGGPVYELRTYTTAPGKLPILLDRFGRHNLPLFEKHGIELIGAWTPAGPESGPDRLVYLVRFPGREAAARAWQAFAGDPDWKAIFGAEKEAHGQVVSGVESVYLAPTDYSPDPARVEPPATGALYELRTYTTSPGRLDALNRRFRDHTVELFRKHGMTNVVYGVPMDESKGSADTLVYLLAHAGREEAAASWEAFRDDPAWQRARAASEADGVKLAAEVESAYLKPAPFSPLK